jgi:hypothetical protein
LLYLPFQNFVVCSSYIRDKKVVGVFCAGFRAPLQRDSILYLRDIFSR